MAKGIPAAGFRMTKNRIAKGGFDFVRGPETPKSVPVIQVAPVKFETDEQILAKLEERFDVLSTLTDAAITGITKSLIVSGPAGLGKSFTVEKALEKHDPKATRHEIIKGYVRATGLFRSLYEYRHKGNTIVFDDADAIFFDDVSLNLLKAACDSTEKRVISWRSEARFEDDEGQVIPRSFQFNGSIIFITNLDFYDMINRGHKLAPHLKALESRSFYVDLELKTKRDYLLRIKQVIDVGMLAENGCDKREEEDVVNFIEKNVDSLREISLRMAIKLAILRKTQPKKFEHLAKITCCR